MEKFNLYELNNFPVTDGVLSNPQQAHSTEKLKSYNQNKSLYENDPKSFDPYFKNDPHLNVIYQDDGFTMGYDSVRSTGRNLPNNPPVLQTNYFEEDYVDTLQNNEGSDYNRILERYYDSEGNTGSKTNAISNLRSRPDNLSTTKRNRQNSSHSKKRKYSKHSLNQGLNSNRNSYDPWRDIYQQDLYKGPPSSSIKHPSSYRTSSKETTTSKDYKGYQVMASNVLYKTKSNDGSESDDRDINEGKKGLNRSVFDRNGIVKYDRDIDLEDQEKFAAEFQQQHHQHRWGQAIGNLMRRKTNPGRITRRFDRKPPNRRQSSGFGQKSGGVYQSPLLKTFSTTSRDSFYDYEDPISDRYDDMGEYMDDDTHLNGNIRNGVIEKVSNVLDYDFYGDGSDYGMQMTSSNSATGIGFADTITRRISDAVFSPTVITIIGLVSLPLILAAAYWLFVVNGPTPVVKARIDDLLGLKSGNTSDESAALGMNNFVDGGGDLTYTEVSPIWDAIGKPVMNTLFSIVQRLGSVSPDTTSSNNDGGFINSKPLLSGILGDDFFR